MEKSLVISILMSCLFVFVLSDCVAAAGHGEGIDSVLTLGRAVELALENNPLLLAYGWEVGAMEADADQAGAFPNPELASGIENAWGTGSMTGGDAAETTLLLSQEIRTWGKRSKTRKVAAIEAGISRLELDAMRRETVSDTEVLFIELLAAQRAASMAGEMMDLAERMLGTVRERVESGKVAPLEGQKAAVSFSTSRIEEDRLRRALDVARRRLASMWGADDLRFSEVDGDLGEISPPPSPDSLDCHLSRNPELMIAGKALERQEAALSLEKAMRVPDVVLTGGTRWFEETGERALVFGISVQLPLFDRNGAAIRQAQYRLNKAGEARKAAELGLRTRFVGMCGEASSAYRGAVSYRDDVIPAAWSAFETASEGYREGKWGLLEVLDAQRTLIEARKQQVEILVSYHKALSKLGELTGRRLLWPGLQEGHGKGGRS